LVHNDSLPSCSAMTEQFADAVACNRVRPMLIALQQMHASMSQHVAETISHIYELIPEAPDSSRHTRRALFPVGGWILKGLFGTASDADLGDLKAHIRRIGQTVSKAAEVFEVQSNRMSSYMSLVNRRLDGIAEMVTSQSNAVHKVITELTREVETTMGLQLATKILINQTSSYVHVLDNMEKIRTAVENLVHGFLSPVLIKPRSLQNIITLIQWDLKMKYPKFQLLRTTIQHYYASHDFSYSRIQNNLFIQIRFPIATNNIPLTLFEVRSFPVLVPNSEGHTTAVKNLPYGIIASAGYDYFIQLATKPNYDQSDLLFMAKEADVFRPLVNSTSCVGALFQNEVPNIIKQCQFQLTATAMQPSIILLSSTHVLIFNISNITLICSDGTNYIDGCMMCLR
jgi:chorismate mutase